MTGIKRSSKQILPMVIGSTLVLGLIWLNTFIHQNSFSDSYGDFSFLIEIIPAISLATLLNTLVMFRPAVWQSTYSTADCAQDAAWGAIAMMALLFCEIGGPRQRFLFLVFQCRARKLHIPQTIYLRFLGHHLVPDPGRCHSAGDET